MCATCDSRDIISVKFLESYLRVQDSDESDAYFLCIFYKYVVTRSVATRWLLILLVRAESRNSRFEAPKYARLTLPRY